ncbi:MAG: zinc metalloprotease HtpX [Nanoarchaeota archaeon]|nr:zinc metalloprotease HtpX [Nanoarchaeota archaeon]MBU1135636.1 zinc metalloprotease HtpX [Nanoarchaeota archaeon]MBU2520001.1 zinc metalloprotease HtpX [Nanoarchaeota archaeon]
MLGTVALLGTLTGILLAVGWFVGGIFGMTLALILALVLNFVSYWYSDKIVLKIYKAKPSDDVKLNSIVFRLAKEAKIPAPRVYTVPTKVPNAFATGRNKKNAVVAVTDGLMSLDDNEMEGVIAHELGHIKNNDMLTSAVAATVAGAISYLAHIGYWSMFAGDSRGQSNIIGLILMIVFAPLAALLVRMAISRNREYEADKTSALLTKNPAGLASALRKIEAIAKNYPLRGSNATSHMWIANPFKRDSFGNLFASHPPMEKRIERLEEMNMELL